MSILVRARFDVRDQRQADFEQVVLALREQMKDEAGTLAYRWFSAGAGGYLVLDKTLGPICHTLAVGVLFVAIRKH